MFSPYNYLLLTMGRPDSGPSGGHLRAQHGDALELLPWRLGREPLPPRRPDMPFLPEGQPGKPGTSFRMTFS